MEKQYVVTAYNNKKVRLWSSVQPTLGAAIKLAREEKYATIQQQRKEDLKPLQKWSFVLGAIVPNSEVSFK